jgi:hypothetical protein
VQKGVEGGDGVKVGYKGGGVRDGGGMGVEGGIG